MVVAAAARRQAGSDEVTLQGGLRLWQLGLRPVPVLTGAVVQWTLALHTSVTPLLFFH